MSNDHAHLQMCELGYHHWDAGSGGVLGVEPHVAPGPVGSAPFLAHQDH